MITNITAEIRPVRPTLLPRQPFSFLGLEAENKSLFSWNVEIERKPNIILRILVTWQPSPSAALLAD